MGNNNKKKRRGSRVVAAVAFTVMLLAASPVALGALVLFPVDEFTSAHWQADYPDWFMTHWWGGTNIPTWSLLGWQRNDQPQNAVERVQTDWREADTTDCWAAQVELERFETEDPPAEGSDCFDGTFDPRGSTSVTFDSCSQFEIEDEVRQTRNDLLDLDFDQTGAALPNDAAVGYRSQLTTSDLNGPGTGTVTGCYRIFWAAP